MSIKDVTILVVDDNPATLYSTSRVLRSAGWTVIEAVTGEEGYDKALAGVDLLVLDVNLPDIDGFEVCRRLRAQETTTRLPILHLSATFVSSDYKVTGLDGGADGYLTHPIEPPVLIATVNAFLRTREAEIELRQSEARFKAIFDNALTGVALLDDDFKFVDVNPTICRILSMDRGHLISRPINELIPRQYLSSLDEISDRLRHQFAWHGAFPMVRADGSEVFLEWHMSIHTDRGLRLAIINDISQRLRYEEERESLLKSERAARADAERANRLKDDFLATLSHELRTPLNAIVGWSQLLRIGKLSDADFKEGVEAIERNARAQAQMIADLLDVSRITSGKIRLDLEMIDPATVIDAALSSISPTAEAKSIRLTKALDSNAGPVSADASRLQQIIWNLVSNAVKFTPKQGRVHVTLHRVNSHIEIRVSDNGPGINDELLQTIFQRFSQGDSSSTREHGGLGLGLAISKQLVEMHGGTIAAESEGPDRGSTFIISLPLMACQRVETATADPLLTQEAPFRPPATVNLAGTRVLLVEDDADSRTLMHRIISACGAEVFDAASVEEALDALKRFQPSVLISDLGMPGRDGFDLIREVRQLGFSFQHLPAVALTAFARTEDRRRALLAGFQVHLAKPVDPHELTAVIASLIGRTG